MSSETIKIFGKVTDFQSNPLSGAIVQVFNDRFEELNHTYTNDLGQFELVLNRGLYYAFYACKDYKVNYLEYWAWNLPAYQDLEINPRIDGLEIYSLIAFKILRAAPQLMLYFRPMSLKRAVPYLENQKTEIAKKRIDIAPNLTTDDIRVFINGQESDIYQINKVQEYGDGLHMYAYLVHVSLDEKVNIYEYNRIDLTLKDSETGELGEGTTYWKQAVTSS